MGDGFQVGRVTAAAVTANVVNLQFLGKGGAAAGLKVETVDSVTSALPNDLRIACRVN
jgi:hypothetical protein